jgi:positive regulator of sigma E activity
MTELKEGKPEHVDGEGLRKGEPTENPVARGLNVTVSIPETVEIRMVDASALADYEVWFLISSILSSGVIGFLVAYLQDNRNRAFGAMSLVLGILLAISLLMTFWKRHKVRKKSKDIILRATEIVKREDV